MPASTLTRFQRITPQQLRAFEATARLQSVTQAAKELYVSQPTVSVQLRELAATLGQPLFEPLGRKIRLTQEGELLYKTVKELSACWQRLESNLSELKGLISGRLRIAAVTTTEYFVPELIGPFANAYQGVELELAIENRDRIVERLSKGIDDLTVMMMPPKDLELNRLSFLPNPLVIIAAKQHPLVGQSLSLSHLADQRWLMREPGSGTRMAAETYFHQLDFQPNIAMSLGSNEAIKHAVAAGLGIGVISNVAIQSALTQVEETFSSQNLTILDIKEFPLLRDWLIVWRKDLPLSAAARCFVDYLKESKNLI